MTEVLIQTLTALLFIVFASFAEGVEWKERYLTSDYKEQEQLNARWHWLQLFERIFAVLFGFSAGLFSGLSFTAFKVFFIAALGFWIIYDAIINYYAGRDLFKPSSQSTSPFEKLYWLKPLLLIAAIILLAAGCGSVRVTESERIRVDTIKAVSPVIEDVLGAKTVTDTVIITNKIVQQDTVIDVRYYPVEKKFWIKAKPDTVIITRIDTLTQVKITETGSGGSYTGLVLVGFIVLLIIIVTKTRN